MALVIADRVKESTTTTGTSDFALGGAATGFQSFADGVGANNTTYYAVSQGADWEVGLGTLSSDGLTLARTTVLQSSNSDTKVSFASGAKEVFVTYAADKAVFEDASGNVTLPANLTVTGGSTTDSVQLDLTAGVTPAVGQIAWDASQGTATLGLLGGNVLSRLGQTLVAYVTNAESTTITKGQAVYLFSAQGDRATVKLANNTGDATSAKTLGIVAEDITANGTGFVVCQGVVYGLDLSAYTAGDTLYLGSTAGSLTSTKPYAPNHLVYLGVVEKANAGAGQLYVRVQNGYELDELHNVSAQSPSDGQTIVYNSSTSLWEKNTVSLTAGINGILPIANGGTNASDASTARTNLAVAGTGVSNTFSANQIVSVTDNTNSAVRITQLGTGNALLVEDSSNPDATPTVIDASGRLIIGTTTTLGYERLQTVNTDAGFFYAGGLQPKITLYRARGTIASPTGVTAGDTLGSIQFGGYTTNNAGYSQSGSSISSTFVSEGTFGEIASYLTLTATESNGNTGSATLTSSSGVSTLTAGVFNSYSLTASKTVFTDASKNLTTTGTVAIANGGTGATTLAGASIVTYTGTETLTNKTFTGYTETIFAVSGTTPALSPNNGTIQTWTLSGNSTPTQGTWGNGQSITLMIDDGTAYTITWTSLPVTWKTDSGSAPTLNTTGVTAIVLWEVGSVIYGARVGNA